MITNCPSLSDVRELQEVFGGPVCDLAGGDRLVLDRRIDLDLTKVGVATLLVVGLHRNLKTKF